MKNKTHQISIVEPDSIAEELGLEPGDQLLTINEQQVRDVFDYHYLMQDEYIEILIKKTDGEEWLLEIEKEYEEDLGVQFENSLMDDYRSCCNKCMFCFIDQMPAGMRETLYFKDDDSRLSFLQGNYVTLTNMKDSDIERIIEYKLSPINVSIHTTNPELRCQMLNNRFAGAALKKLDRLYEAGIAMNGQIVLCKGVNDGAELERSIRELSAYIPHLGSVSVVPAGMTKYRDGLYPLELFTKAEAGAVLDQIHTWQERLYEQYGTHFIHAGDEWYILAERPLPPQESYDGYLQLENGVGMMRLLLDEFEEAYAKCQGDERRRHISVATGILAGDYIQQMLGQLQQKYPGLQVQLYRVENQFFGEQITVSGLLTGQDFISQLKGKELGTRLLLPENVLRTGESVFLDDITLEQLEDTLQVEVDIVKSSGSDFIEAVLK